MNDKEYLISQFKRLNNIDLLNSFFKLIPLLLFVFINPFVMYFEFINKNFFTFSFLIIAEILFAFLAYTIFLNILKIYDFSKSKIFYSIKNKEIVNKIILSNNKILFDLIGTEDEIVYLSNSDLKSKIVFAMKKYFGESKVEIKK
jgi:hypothetical protein